MTSATTLVRIVAVGLAVLAAGCNLNLDTPTLVKTPRILAIVADTPEAAPGEDIAISVMAFDPMGRDLRYRFELCFDGGSILDAESFDPDHAICFRLEHDEFRTTVPGAFTQFLANQIDAFTPEQTGGFDVTRIQQIVHTVGFPVRVQVDVVAPDGTILVSGHKLVGITTRAERTVNPPAPFLFVDGTPYVGAFDPESFDCVTPFPEPVVAGAQVALQPGDDADTWTEEYPVYDYTGGMRVAHEGGYYSWYANGGTMPEETTRHPSEGTHWEAPMEPGIYRLWYVVRDGHLGSSACTFELEVRPGDPSH
jgi:hypothetical protein